MSREQDIRNRLRIQRENIDAGLRECLSTPNGRRFIWWLYALCHAQRDVVYRADQTDASVPMTFRALGKQAIGLELENRAKLIDHKSWLIMLAENDRPLDDGRAQDKQDAAQEIESE